MLAARLHAPGEPLSLDQVPLPEPVGTEVRVRVAGCGVCRTDLRIASGETTRVELPLTLGHEIAGWIEAAGGEASPLLQDAGLSHDEAVVVFGGWGCGVCGECRTGQEQRCPYGRSPGFQVDGGYAEAVLVPHPRHLVPLEGLEPVHAAPLADAGVTSYRAVARAEPWLVNGGRVLVIGLGGLGQFAVQYLRQRNGVRIAVVEPNGMRRQLADSLGADVALADGEPASIRGALGGDPDVVFDFVGSDLTIGQASAIVARGGLVMLVGEAGGHARFGFDMPLESWLTTTTWGSLGDLRDVVAIARRGGVQWATETMPLTDAQDAFARLAAGTVAGRIVLLPTRTA
jgi:alcohol dehydrogenase, propanol-preferring